MGILSGFIGGAARATGEIANQRIARYTAEELQRQRDLMDQERERRIEEAQIAREGRVVAQRDKDRTDTVKRIDNESMRIADAETEKASGLIYSKQHLLEQTPEWQEKTDQELASKRQSIASNADTRFQAAVNTGDISAKDAQVLLDSKSRIEAADRQQGIAAKNAEMRDATERYKADLKAKSDEMKDATANKRIETLFLKMQGGGGSDKEVMGFLRETRMSLNDESKRLSDQMKSELEDVKYDPDAAAKVKAQYKPKFDELEKQQKRNAADLDVVRTKFGLPKDESVKEPQAATSDPLAAAFAALAKQKSGAGNTPAPAAESAPAPSGLIAPRKAVDTSARDAEIARMNTLSGTSSNRTAVISKKREEVASNFDDKLSLIKRGMTRDEAFKVSTWFDENSGYMTPAQLKQVREAKSRVGM